MRKHILAGALAAAASAQTFTIDADPCLTGGSCRALDGIGGLSGGGATSVLLPSYPEPQRTEILDFLFKPNYGASLHMLKVEIGGDAQSTDGAESSHMHNPWEENYQRGYEWWLLSEAKKRNPSILAYGLSWAFPQWVSCNPGTLTNCSSDPYTHPDQTANYITKWVAGAKNTYDLDIDYIGSWNERAYNIDYLKLLRKTLDAAGFPNTKIVAPDSNWGIASDILKDPELAASLYGIGCHYPGTYSSSEAVQTGKPLWASEDDSTYNNDVGASCWARVINENYVNGNMTLSMNWNLLSAYMKGTNWYRAGIFNAMQPWNGAYGSFVSDGSWTVGPMVWATAHTTQFTQPGWLYTRIGGGAGTGSGHLSIGGSYVSLVSPDGADFTLVIEKFERNHSSCVRPGLGNYVTQAETAKFQLAGKLAASLAGKTLQVWYTHWAYYPGDKSVEFTQQAPLTVGADGSFSVSVPIDSITTISTVTTATKGAPAATPPAPVLFPAAHTDDFEACAISSEAPYFTDQNGIFECYPSGDASHGTVMRQMVPLRPITWGGDIRPHSLIGHRDSRNQSLVVDGFIEAPGQSILLGLHMQGTDNSAGLIWSCDTSGTWWLHAAIGDVDSPSKAIKSGSLPVNVSAGTWHTYRIDVNGSTFSAWVDSVPVSTVDVTNYATSGHGAIGAREYNHFTRYDNFQIYSTYVQCGATPLAAEAPVSMTHCSSEVGLQTYFGWDFRPTNAAGSNYTGVFSLRSNPALCVAAVAGGTAVALAACNPSDANQVFAWSFEGIAPDTERKSQIASVGAGGKCLDITGQLGDIGLPIGLFACNGGGNQAFFYSFDEGEIANEAYSLCLGVC